MSTPYLLATALRVVREARGDLRARAERWIEDAYEEAAVASVNLVDGIEDVGVTPELPRKQRAAAAYVGFELNLNPPA